MKTAATSTIAYGSVLAAQLALPDDVISRIVQLLGLLVLLLNTYLEWRRRQNASRS